MGQFGERVAAAHLEAEGYRILARNFRCPEGEIDIIVHKGETVAFVEVRTRRGSAMGRAADSLTLTKGARITAAAESYCQQHTDLPEERRIDVITIDLSPQGKVLRLEHIESAFAGDELPSLPGR